MFVPSVQELSFIWVVGLQLGDLSKHTICIGGSLAEGGSAVHFLLPQHSSAGEVAEGFSAQVAFQQQSLEG